LVSPPTGIGGEFVGVYRGVKTASYRAGYFSKFLFLDFPLFEIRRPYAVGKFSSFGWIYQNANVSKRGDE